MSSNAKALMLNVIQSDLHLTLRRVAPPSSGSAPKMVPDGHKYLQNHGAPKPDSSCRQEAFGLEPLDSVLEIATP